MCLNWWLTKFGTVIRLFEDAHFLGLIFETSKEIWTWTQGASCIRDFLGNPKKKPSFIIHFSSVSKTVLSYDYEVRYAIVLHYEYRFGRE